MIVKIVNEMGYSECLFFICRVIYQLVRRYGVIELDHIGSGNGLLLGQHQAITSINADLVLVGSQETKVKSTLSIKVQKFSKKMQLKMSSAKCMPFYLSLCVTM